MRCLTPFSTDRNGAISIKLDTRYHLEVAIQFRTNRHVVSVHKFSSDWKRVDFNVNNVLLGENKKYHAMITNYITYKTYFYV